MVEYPRYEICHGDVMKRHAATNQKYFTVWSEDYASSIYLVTTYNQRGRLGRKKETGKGEREERQFEFICKQVHPSKRIYIAASARTWSLLTTVLLADQVPISRSVKLSILLFPPFS